MESLILLQREPNMYIKINTNAKLAESDSNYLFGHYSLPAIVTCPNAGKCKTGCYATQGNYRYQNVQDSYKRNLELTRNLPLFEQIMASEIAKLDAKAKKMGKYLALRIHTSGDFYSREYYLAWHRLAEAFPSVKFYAYTKMVTMLQGFLRGFNFTVIYSEGGLQDSAIFEGSRHARVFPSIEALHAAGYDDASHDDSVAFKSVSGKIGLVYHGSAKREWTTNSNDKENWPKLSLVD